jgi:hypothetical protein
MFDQELTSADASMTRVVYAVGVGGLQPGTAGAAVTKTATI